MVLLEHPQGHRANPTHRHRVACRERPADRVGIPRRCQRNDLPRSWRRGRKPPDFTGNRHLAISPFVNAEGLDTVAPSADPAAISRPEQLELLATDVLAGLDCRSVATPTIGDDAEERPSPHLGELHAKVIVANVGDVHMSTSAPANAYRSGVRWKRRDRR